MLDRLHGRRLIRCEKLQEMWERERGTGETERKHRAKKLTVKQRGLLLFLAKQIGQQASDRDFAIFLGKKRGGSEIVTTMNTLWEMRLIDLTDDGAKLTDQGIAEAKRR